MSELSPATLEGWYSLHQVISTDWGAVRALAPEARSALARETQALAEALAEGEGEGWSAFFRLAGGRGDWLLLHFRPTLDALAEVQLRLRRSRVGPLLTTGYDYVSVTEAGLYYATAEAAREAEYGTPEFERLLGEAAEAERASPHARLRLYPQIPEGMRYACFYPMSKRRHAPHNWYTLPVAERSRLMREHGLTGRRYAKRIYQIIGGSVGFDAWEWGVTLFAHDPLDFKKIVTEMRYDEASALYGEFGPFYTGVRLAPAEWAALLAEPGSPA